MYGNGVAIGIALVIHRHHKLILPDPLQALSACSAEVVGSAMLRAAECRIAAAPASATAAPASG